MVAGKPNLIEPIRVTVRPCRSAVRSASPRHPREVGATLIYGHCVARIPHSIVEMLVIELHLPRREVQRLPERISWQPHRELDVSNGVPESANNEGERQRRPKGQPKWQ